jgi:hypothetical protein
MAPSKRSTVPIPRRLSSAHAPVVQPTLYSSFTRIWQAAYSAASSELSSFVRSVSGSEGGRTGAREGRVKGERDGPGRDSKRVKREPQGVIGRQGKTRPSRTSIRLLQVISSCCLLLTIHSCAAPEVSHVHLEQLLRYHSTQILDSTRTRDPTSSNDTKKCSRPSPRTTTRRHKTQCRTTIQAKNLRARGGSSASPNRGESESSCSHPCTHVSSQINSRAISPNKPRSPSKRPPPPPPAPPPPPYLAAPPRIPTLPVKVKRVSPHLLHPLHLADVCNRSY